MSSKKNTVAIKRKDAYYNKAKISGFRARSAYKLLQLNTKYEFLLGAKVCIDLCAAPGSWMQVASKTMKPPCVVIGVDLHKIPPVPNATSIQGDITTDKVRQELKSNLKSYKADVVLHDGAPNVGNNWHQDAYNQNILVVHAFRLACEFLKNGGTFVTKVFRSKDHTSLEFIFKKLFKKVESTKPKSSRFESAEIFMVCQKFLSPDKIDPKFFDPKYVFSNLDTQPRNAINLKNPEKTKRKPVGYEDGITMLFKKFKLSAFIDSPEFIEMIEVANEFVWDLPQPDDKGTKEIQELCKDIKVLGRKDIRAILNFRKKKREESEQLAEKNANSEEAIKQCQRELEAKSLAVSQPLQQAHAAKEKLMALEEELTKEEATVREFDALQQAQKELDEIKAELMRESKRKVRKLRKQRAKMMQRLQLKLMVPGDAGPQAQEDGLFTVNNFEDVENIDNIVNDSKLSTIHVPKRKILEPIYEFDYDTKENEIDMDSSDLLGMNDDADFNKDAMVSSLGVRNMEDFKVAPEKKNRFIDQLLEDAYGEADEIHAEKWFSKESYANLDDDAIMDYELDAALSQANENKKGSKKKIKQTEEMSEEELDENNKEEFDESVDYDAFLQEVPEDKKLDALGLALAAKMMTSKKGKRNVIEDSWNRRTYGDLDDKPDWFETDEKQHNDKRIEVDPEDLRIHRNRIKGVDVRTLKKVVEAKARKARRMKKKMDKANEKVKVITDQQELSEKEKSLEIKKVYDKVRPKKKEVRYVPMKKGAKGMKRGAGKGPYRLVDRRLKKDKRARALIAKKKKKK